MRDLGQDAAAGGASGAIVEPRLLGDLDSWIGQLATNDEPPSDAQRIDALRKLEDLTCAAAAASAELSADFDASQRAKAAKAGEPQDRQGRGVASQIALARRVSPHRTQRQLAIAKLLRKELPHTLAARLPAALASYVAEHGISRLGVCRSDPCRCVFVDRTRAGTRKYCCTYCNDRYAARAYRRRKRS